MITESEFVEKVSALMDTAKDDAITEAKRIYRTNAINPSEYENNYILPKCFLVVRFEHLSETVYPKHIMTPKLKALIKNIKHF